MMKLVAYYESVLTPKYVIQKNAEKFDPSLLNLDFPVFVKPAKAGDSLGIDQDSKVDVPENYCLN